MCVVVGVLGGCGGGSTADPTPDAFQVEFPYPTVAPDPQRTGDAAKGYDYLVNGGYITCGLPKSLYDSVFGPAPASERIDGRTGDNATLPYNFGAATSSEGVKVVSANCLQCHASHLNGKVVVGLGAADGDFTGNAAAQINAVGGLISDPTEHAEWQRFDEHMQAIAPYTQTLTVGANPADNLTAALMAHRDPETLAWLTDASLPLPPAVVVPVDVPPWWRMKKKNAMFYSAAGRGDHARIEMAASLLCSDSVAEVTAIDAAFVDVEAYIASIEPPKWPYKVDADLAARGEQVFLENCAECHGTYGASPVYPNEVVPLDVIGTDPLLASGASQFGADYIQWFATSFWGQTSRLEPQQGYIAPPLDGVWATAPYLHNGSVPTIETLLDSSKRPAYWTRSFDSSDYNDAEVGWRYSPVDHGQGDETNQNAKKKLYDTTQAGYGNGGHTFGDTLSDADRKAVIEYIKTL